MAPGVEPVIRELRSGPEELVVIPCTDVQVLAGRTLELIYNDFNTDINTELENQRLTQPSYEPDHDVARQLISLISLKGNVRHL